MQQREREELDVPFPVAITRQNIKTELNEIKKKKRLCWTVVGQ